MRRTQPLLLVLLTALLAFAPLTAAQTQVTPDLLLTPESRTLSVRAGQTAQHSVLALIQAEGFACAQDAELPVTLEAASPEIAIAITPTTTTITIPQGAYTTDPSGSGAPVEPFYASAPFLVTFRAPEGRTSQSEVTIPLVATIEATEVVGCAPVGFAATSAQSLVTLRILPDATPAAEPAPTPAPTPAPAQPQSGPETNDSPAPALLAPLALGLLALAARRGRRDDA